MVSDGYSTRRTSAAVMAFHSWRDADGAFTRVPVKDRARTLKSTFAADLPLFAIEVVNLEIAENRRYRY